LWGFGVWGLGFGVEGVGLRKARVLRAGKRTGSGFKVHVLGLRVSSSGGFGVRISGFGVRVSGLGGTCKS
jgi:hypothetical protein